MTELSFDNPSPDGPRVFIVGRPALTRAGVRTLLSEQGATVVGASSSLASSDQIPPACDVVVLLDPDDLTELINAQSNPERPALLLLSDGWPNPAPTRHVWGIVPPDAAANELWAAVQALAVGLCVLPPALLAHHERPGLQTLHDDASNELLTSREFAILQLLAEGLTNRQIAGRTTISEHTVKFHLSSIFSKLGVASRTEAIRVGAQRGLVVW